MKKIFAVFLRSLIAPALAGSVVLIVVIPLISIPFFSNGMIKQNLITLIMSHSPLYSIILMCILLFSLLLLMVILTGVINIYLFKPLLSQYYRTMSNNLSLQKTDEMKNEFIANVAHDFRSPLTVILNKSDLMMRFDTELKTKTKKGVSIIHESAVKLEDTVDRLLNLAKLDWEGVELSVQKIDLTSFINTISQFYQQVLHDTGITLVTNLTETEIDNCYTDIEKFEEVLDNIISNAIKFVDNKTGVISLELQCDSKTISILISDNGIGIAEKQLDMIFERFKQVENLQVSGGSGIGLAYSRKLMESLHGMITASSKGDNQGSCFTLTLPRGKDHFSERDFSREKRNYRYREKMQKIIQSIINSKNETNDLNFYLQDRNGDEEYNLKKAVILIIDPSRETRRIIVEYLLYSGFTNFITSSSGLTGLQAIYDHKPDIILSEFDLPGLNGDGLLNMLQTNPDYNKIPFVFVSALPVEKIASKLQVGDKIISLAKPIIEKELILTISMHISRHFEYRRSLSLTTIDELTGVLNRKSVLKQLKSVLSRRILTPLSIIYFDIEDLYQVYPKNESIQTDWGMVLNMKLQLAEDAMYKAKQSECLACGYSTTKENLFTGGKCPMCSSKKLLIGRNRVMLFGRLSKS